MNLLPLSSTLSPFSPMRSLENDLSALQWQMDNMMNDLWEGNSLLPRSRRQRMGPAVDIQDLDDKYKIEVEIPGMSKDDVTLDLHNNILTIKGEKETVKDSKTSNYVYQERNFGSFRRDIPFDDEIKTEKVKAELNDGVLCIELEKKNRTKETHKSIPIKH